MMPVNNYNPSYSAFLQTDTSPAASMPRSKEQYYAIWSAWEKDAPLSMGELRDVAVARMCDCLDKKTESLDLKGLNLSSLPYFLPEHILELDVSENQLSMLPEYLPKKLYSLYSADNKLTSLPNEFPKRLFGLILYSINLKLHFSASGSCH